MQTCRKTHRKFTGTELIGKGGGKLEAKGTKVTGEIIIVVQQNIQQAITILALKKVKTLE